MNLRNLRISRRLGLAFGAILAVMAIRTGRLGASIVTHAVFNLFTLLYLTFTG